MIANAAATATMKQTTTHSLKKVSAVGGDGNAANTTAYNAGDANDADDANHNPAVCATSWVRCAWVHAHATLSDGPLLQLREPS